MLDVLAYGTPVHTKKPAQESVIWPTSERARRRWEQAGLVSAVAVLFDNDMVYQVQHSDGSLAWYERRELQRMNVTAYTEAELTKLLGKMHQLASLYYSHAARIGVHAFIEFAGLMNEFIKVCTAAHAQGLDFTMANTHTGKPLPMEPYHARYLAEKLNCIYGPGLLSSEANREAFINVLFEGQYSLQPAQPMGDPYSVDGLPVSIARAIARLPADDVERRKRPPGDQ